MGFFAELAWKFRSEKGKERVAKQLEKREEDKNKTYDPKTGEVGIRKEDDHPWL